MSSSKKLWVTTKVIGACAVSLLYLLLCVGVNVDMVAEWNERLPANLFIGGISLMPAFLACLWALELKGRVAAASARIIGWVGGISTACYSVGLVWLLLNKHNGW